MYSYKDRIRAVSRPSGGMSPIGSQRYTGRSTSHLIPVVRRIESKANCHFSGSVQRDLSADRESLGFFQFVLPADKR